MKREGIKNIFAGILALALIAGQVLYLSPVVEAYGPERTTFTNQQPATYPTFNSITDHVTLGDERDFVRIIEVGQTTYTDTVEVQPGKTYRVAIFYHNNAASNYNESGKGIAKGVRVKTTFSKEVNPGEEGEVAAVIEADNTNPKKVWDSAYMTAKEKVTLRYVSGTAEILNSTATNGSKLPDSFFTADGAYIGSEQMNGEVLGCAEYAGVIVYQIMADAPGSEIDKQVSADGQNFVEEVEVNSGAEVYYQVKFKNTGNTDLTNVIIKDVLPEGLTLVPGSVMFYDSANQNGRAISDEIISETGHNIGVVKVGEEVRVVYKATVSADYCATSLVNNAKVTYDGGIELSDGSTIKVNDCIPSEIPETGPAEIALLIIIGVGVIGGGAYFIHSRRMLKKLTATEIAGGADAMDIDTPDEEEIITETFEEDKED